jgi:predicted Zn-dependent protease
MRFVTLPIALTLSLGATLSLISIEEEIALGRQAQQPVRREVPVLADRQVSASLKLFRRRERCRAADQVRATYGRTQRRT